jgi:Protein of unknown function (DUF3618)
MTASEVPAQSPPDDVQQLEAEIAATRERLGDAVEELVAKLDVKSQARAQATRITSQVTGAAQKARGQAVAQAAKVRGQLAAQSGKARGQLAVTAAKTRDQAASAADGAKGPGRHAAETGTRLVKQRRVQIGAAAALLIAGLLAVLLRRKR